MIARTATRGVVVATVILLAASVGRAAAEGPDAIQAGSGSASPSAYWAFKPPQRPEVPRVKRKTWVRTPVDAFIAVAQEARGLEPAPETPRHVLIRRLSLDLTGLPPNPEEVAAFVADESSDAYERLVDRLLASPRYGERWGRHWLDLARWAETEGYEGNTFRSSVWKYRDYVVRSFNEDKPYDVFLRQQIAGDEIEPYSDENTIATGFLSSARYSHNEEDKAVQRNDVLVDIANATAAVTLGLTLNCAQCHDHKFEPISARDYYRWQGFFVRGQLVYLLLRDPEAWRAYKANEPPELEPAKKLRGLLLEPIERRLRAEAREKLSPELREVLDKPEGERTPEQQELAKKAEAALQIPRDKIEAALSEDDRKLVAELSKKIEKVEKDQREWKPQMWGFYSPASSPHALEMLPPKGDYPLPYVAEELKATRPTVLVRGSPHRRDEELEPGWPEVLGPTPSGLLEGRSRLALVDWLTSPQSPLTARVWVNFVWQQHFRRGIVATPGDFGVRGAPPSHPELLDWLATELVQSGWSTKHIHRMIILSSTYRQASHASAANEAIDPENRFLWRWMPRRLEAEAIRDSALCVSGELDLATGGPSIAPEQQDQAVRRSLYLRQVRDNPLKHLAMFDGPNTHESCPSRHVSTVPLQSLYLMNSRFWTARAEALARRVSAAAGSDRQRAVTAAFEICFARQPTPRECELADAFFVHYGQSNRATDEESKAQGDEGLSPESLVHFCHALLGANEFVYLE